MFRLKARTAALSALVAVACAIAATPGPASATTGSPVAAVQSDATYDVAIDATKIAADNVNGLTFKGFGTLSANSTSALLMDYKAQQPEKYAELLQVLFGGEHPLMNQVKIEMGDDRNNSTGSDVATMRTADEEANVTRHPVRASQAAVLAAEPPGVWYIRAGVSEPVARCPL